MTKRWGRLVEFNMFAFFALALPWVSRSLVPLVIVRCATFEWTSYSYVPEFLFWPLRLHTPLYRISGPTVLDRAIPWHGVLRILRFVVTFTSKEEDAIPSKSIGLDAWIFQYVRVAHVSSMLSFQASTRWSWMCCTNVARLLVIVSREGCNARSVRHAWIFVGREVREREIKSGMPIGLLAWRMCRKVGYNAILLCLIDASVRWLLHFFERANSSYRAKQFELHSPSRAILREWRQSNVENEVVHSKVRGFVTFTCRRLMHVTLCWSRVSLDLGKHGGVRRCYAFEGRPNDYKYFLYYEGKLYQDAVLGMRWQAREDCCSIRPTTIFMSWVILAGVVYLPQAHRWVFVLATMLWDGNICY